MANRTQQIAYSRGAELAIRFDDITGVVNQVILNNSHPRPAQCSIRNTATSQEVAFTIASGNNNRRVAVAPGIARLIQVVDAETLLTSWGTAPELEIRFVGPVP